MTRDYLLHEIAPRLRPAWSAVLTFLLAHSDAHDAAPVCASDLVLPWGNVQPLGLGLNKVYESVRALRNLRLLTTYQGVVGTGAGAAMRVEVRDADDLRELARALDRANAAPGARPGWFHAGLERANATPAFWAEFAPHFHGDVLGPTELLARAFFPPTESPTSPRAAHSVNPIRADYGHKRFPFGPFSSFGLRRASKRQKLAWMRRALDPRSIRRRGASLLYRRLAEWPCWKEVRPYFIKMYGRKAIKLDDDGVIDEAESWDFAVETLAALQRLKAEPVGDARTPLPVFGMQVVWAACKLYGHLRSGMGILVLRRMLHHTSVRAKRRIDPAEVMPRLAGYALYVRRITLRGGIHVPVRDLDAVLGPAGTRWFNYWCAFVTRRARRRSTPVADPLKYIASVSPLFGSNYKSPKATSEERDAWMTS